jgi:hypothetical protein
MRQKSRFDWFPTGTFSKPPSDSMSVTLLKKLMLVFKTVRIREILNFNTYPWMTIYIFKKFVLIAEWFTLSALIFSIKMKNLLSTIPFWIFKENIFI